MLPDKWIETGYSEGTPRRRLREIFALVVLAYARGEEGLPWGAYFDEAIPEPNDGCISDGREVMVIENKLVPAHSRDVLFESFSRYEKFARMQSAYGGGRNLVIHANAGDGTMVKVSDVRDAIDAAGDCPFDRVFQLHCVVDRAGGAAIMHIVDAYPKIPSTRVGAGLTEVAFQLDTGRAEVRHSGIEW